MRAARPTIRRFLKIVGRASLTRRLPRHPLPEGEGTHDKQVSVFEDRPEPHPAWVSGELIAVFRTLVTLCRRSAARKRQVFQQLLFTSATLPVLPNPLDERHV